MILCVSIKKKTSTTESKVAINEVSNYALLFRWFDFQVCDKISRSQFQLMWNFVWQKIKDASYFHGEIKSQLHDC